ncbi:hypothetical protein KKR91_07660 [Arthrobacter jiangjiafuii]|uniref:Uncharacterized protein n=1 Tax=Arthrobacter jiangjiafuii TaxID=2817475 RepID=A0A975M7X4_9MICC|nr:hypothetical protein [Arthrobacter jiangjiafuii]MBP3042881.1 hypothetical protein [Arthrobacter jiangjiafuii]QWC11414.1 hypothetical protein KKR91_07660 [Arthrobacter jiangjiafuii]
MASADQSSAGRGTTVLSLIATGISIVALVLSGLDWAYPFFGLTTPGDKKANESAASSYFHAAYSDSSAPEGTPDSGVSKALTHASPGSPAEQFILILQGMWSAYPAREVEYSDDSYNIDANSERVNLCATDNSSNCLTYANFNFDEYHRLIDFTVNGIPVSQIVTPASNEDQLVGPLKVKFLGGHKLAYADSYRFSVEVTNNSDADLSIKPAATYVGNQDDKQDVNMVGHTQLLVGQSTRLYVAANGQKGGQLKISIEKSGSDPAIHTIRIP